MTARLNPQTVTAMSAEWSFAFSECVPSVSKESGFRARPFDTTEFESTHQRANTFGGSKRSASVRRVQCFPKCPQLRAFDVSPQPLQYVQDTHTNVPLCRNLRSRPLPTTLPSTCTYPCSCPPTIFFHFSCPISCPRAHVLQSNMLRLLHIVLISPMNGELLICVKRCKNIPALNL